MPESPTRLVASVLLTCAVAAAGLGATYSVTAPRIAEQIRQAEQRSLKSAMPAADSFEPVTEKDMLARAGGAAEPARLDGLFRATASDGSEAGWAVKVGSRGYGGFMTVVVGVDRSGKVTGVSVLSHGETPGLGTKVIESESFMEQFLSWEAGSIEKDARDLDAISGATRSSRGVSNAVIAAGKVASEVGGTAASEEGGGK